MGRWWFHPSRAVANPMLLVAVLLTACGVANPSRPTALGDSQSPAASQTLIGLFGKEPASVAVRAFVQQGTSLGSTFRVFNALLTLSDARGVPQPELLDNRPTLNSDSWQVFPDGR